MPPVGFEPITPTSERLRSFALHSAATASAQYKLTGHSAADADRILSGCSKLACYRGTADGLTNKKVGRRKSNIGQTVSI